MKLSTVLKVFVSYNRSVGNLALLMWLTKNFGAMLHDTLYWCAVLADNVSF